MRLFLAQMSELVEGERGDLQQGSMVLEPQEPGQSKPRTVEYPAAGWVPAG